NPAAPHRSPRPELRRVVVTGLGLITSIGTGVEAVWSALQERKPGIRPISRFDASGFRCRVAGEVTDFEPEAYLERKQVRRLDRYSQLAVSASKLALADAALDPGVVDPERSGVCVGSALGGVGFGEENHTAYLRDGWKAVHPMLALSIFIGAGSCNIAIECGFTGPATANGDSCSAGAIALSNALRYIQLGQADRMLAGGVEAPLYPVVFGAFDLIQAMSKQLDPPERACRPFDRTRDGFVMGEGAAMLLLEAEEVALARGARIYGELAGAALTNDAHHMTAPRPDGKSALRCMERALEDAGMTADEVDTVNAHASGTPLNDKTETLALKQLLGERAYSVPVSGVKSLFGHPLGASGAIEAAVSCLSLHHGFIPATANLQEPDPDCDLDYVLDGPRRRPVGSVLSNSFGFGGINAALVFRNGERG
ncbi:MAG TPA: beta-ketoacyl-[acyl-carrier-protein] synthase family protein, partial [Armatimonadota bacterium]|nr:beta-ketoacyl-[acyl-carrier-protein] synthase family protein [Armatimonadota bacterium]